MVFNIWYLLDDTFSFSRAHMMFFFCCVAGKIFRSNKQKLFNLFYKKKSSLSRNLMPSGFDIETLLNWQHQQTLVSGGINLHLYGLFLECFISLSRTKSTQRASQRYWKLYLNFFWIKSKNQQRKDKSYGRKTFFWSL